jgi:hypothetical protein
MSPSPAQRNRNDLLVLAESGRRGKSQKQDLIKKRLPLYDQ